MDKEITEREAFEAWWTDNHSKPFNHKESAIELWKAAYKAGAAVGSDELLQTIMADMLRDGWRQCAKGQHTTQFCGQLESALLEAKACCSHEAAVAESYREQFTAEREVSDKLEKAITNAYNAITIGAASNILMSALAEVEAMRKENGE